MIAATAMMSRRRSRRSHASRSSKLAECTKRQLPRVRSTSGCTMTPPRSAKIGTAAAGFCRRMGPFGRSSVPSLATIRRSLGPSWISAISPGCCLGRGWYGCRRHDAIGPVNAPASSGYNSAWGPSSVSRRINRARSATPPPGFAERRRLETTVKKSGRTRKRGPAYAGPRMVVLGVQRGEIRPYRPGTRPRRSAGCPDRTCRRRWWPRSGHPCRPARWDR